MILLTPTEIGDALDLEQEGIYPCSDGSIHYTLKVDNLLQAQLKKVVGILKERELALENDNRIFVIGDKLWQALLKEVNDG